MSLLSRVRRGRSAAGREEGAARQTELAGGPGPGPAPVWTARPRVWETVPAPAPLLPQMPLVASRDVGASLASWRSAAVSHAPLAHAVSADAPRGTVQVLAVPDPPRAAVGPGEGSMPELDLPVVAEPTPVGEARPAPSGSSPTRPAPGAGPNRDRTVLQDPAPPPPRPSSPDAPRRPVLRVEARPAPRPVGPGPEPQPEPAALPVLQLPARVPGGPSDPVGPGFREASADMPVLRPLAGVRETPTGRRETPGIPPELPGPDEPVTAGSGAGWVAPSPSVVPPAPPSPVLPPSAVRPAPLGAVPSSIAAPEPATEPDAPTLGSSGNGARPGASPDGASHGEPLVAPGPISPDGADHDLPLQPVPLEVALGLATPLGETRPVAGSPVSRPAAVSPAGTPPSPDQGTGSAEVVETRPVVRSTRRGGLGAPLPSVPVTADVPPPYAAVPRGGSSAPLVSDTGQMAVVHPSREVDGASAEAPPVTSTGRDPGGTAVPRRSEPARPPRADATPAPTVGTSPPQPSGPGTAVRAEVGGRVGMDLSRVPVDRGPVAAHAAERMGARAYTSPLGVHVPAEAGPLDSGPGRALLAHELVHVAQQARLGSALPPEHTPAGKTLEAEARAMEHVMAPAPLGRKPGRQAAAVATRPSDGSTGEEARALPLAVHPGKTAAGADRAAIDALLAAMRPDGPTASARASGSVAPAPSPAAPPPPAATPNAGVQRATTEELQKLSSGSDTPADSAAGQPMPRPSDADLTRLAQWLYPIIRYRLRGDLLADRNRAGVLTDLYGGW